MEGGRVSESSIVALVGLAVYAGMRLIDYLMPKGRHWRFVERWTHEDHHDDPDAE